MPKTVDGVKPPALHEIANNPQQVPVPNIKALHYSITTDATTCRLQIESKPYLDSKL